MTHDSELECVMGIGIIIMVIVLTYVAMGG